MSWNSEGMSLSGTDLKSTAHELWGLDMLLLCASVSSSTRWANSPFFTDIKRER